APHAKALDFTILAVCSHPKITEIAHLAFAIFDLLKIKKENRANIIHHPFDPTSGTTYQQFSFRDNVVNETGLFVLHYTTSTMPGSSGAPVMDDEGNLLALHRASC